MTLEVCQRMKSFKSYIPVLFVTGYAMKAQLNELSNLRQEDIRILQKPYTKETLGTTVRDILDSRE